MKPGIKKRVRLLITSNQQKGKNKQNGIALLVLVIIIALTLSTYYFSSISVVDIKIDNLEKTRVALKQAKRALINYAVMHADGEGSGDSGEYGYLPCPHTKIIPFFTEEGVQDGSCGGKNKNSVGYLPWSSLDSNILRDGSGSCLWYAVSGGYKNNLNSDLINEDTNGMFQLVDSGGAVVTGNASENRVVAIILSPGSALDGQSRTVDSATICGDDGTNPSAYLEGNGGTDNAVLFGSTDTIDQFIHASITSDSPVPPSIVPPYNDYFITITREEIWSAILGRSDFNNKMTDLTEVLAKCLSQYAAISTKDRLPWPAPMNLTDYRDDSKYDDASGYTGRFPFIITDSNSAITVGSNGELFTQAACNILGGLTVDLTNTSSEYRILWNNWKDHFFYVLSKDFEPAATTASCGSNCITVNTVPMAGVVIYAGSRQVGMQIRNGAVAAGDVDTKDDISNYIDDASNQAAFIASTGKGAYITTGVNDIMYCIKPDLTVASC